MRLAPKLGCLALIASSSFSACAGRAQSLQASPTEPVARSSAPAPDPLLPAGALSIEVTSVARTRRGLYIELDLVPAPAAQPVELFGCSPFDPYLLVEELRGGTWVDALPITCGFGLDACRMLPGRRVPAALRHELVDRVPVRVGVRYRAPEAEEWRTAWSEPID